MDKLSQIFTLLGKVLTSQEYTAFAVLAVGCVLAMLLRRKQGLRWTVLTAGLSLSYLSQRLAFSNNHRDGSWLWLMLAGALLVVVFSFLEDTPDEQPQPPPRWAEVTLVVLIILAGLVFRAHYFTTLPSGCYYDEAEIGKDYLARILDPKFTWETIRLDHEKNGVPILFWYPAGYFSLILGKACTSVRLAAVISGMLTLPLFYCLLRILFGWRIAMVGLLTMTGSIWHIISSRTGFSCVQCPMFTVMALYFFFLGWKRSTLRSVPWMVVMLLGFAAAWNLPGRYGIDIPLNVQSFPAAFQLGTFLVAIGALMFLGFRTESLWFPLFLFTYYIGQTSYHPSRTIIAYPAIFVGHWLLCKLLAWWYQEVWTGSTGKYKAMVAAATAAVVLAIGGGLWKGYDTVASIPPTEMRKVIQNTFQVQDKVMDLMERRLFFSVVSDGQYFDAWWRHFLRYMSQFHTAGDHNPRHNVPRKPGFDFLTGIFLVPGLAYCLARWRRSEYFMFLCILVVMFLPALISQDSPHFLRSIGILPAVYAFVAFAGGKFWNETANTLWPDVLPLPPSKKVPVINSEGETIGTTSTLAPQPVQLGLGTALKGWSGLTRLGFAAVFTAFWLSSYTTTYKAIFEEYRNDPAMWDMFDSWWYEIGEFINGMEKLAPDSYRVIMLKEFTGNIPALQYVLLKPEVLQQLNYSKHLPLKDPGQYHTYVYILNQNYPDELAMLRQFYPNAVFQEVKNRFGQYSFTAVIVTLRDMADSHGFKETHFSGGQRIYSGKTPTLDFTQGLTRNDFPLPDKILLEGMLYSPELKAYDFEVETDVPLTLRFNGTEVLKVAEGEVQPGQPRQFNFRRSLGQGQFTVDIALGYKPGASTFIWKWNRDGGVMAPIETHYLFTGDVRDPSLMGVMYHEDPLVLKLETSWMVESPNSPASDPQQLFVTMTQDQDGNIYAMRGTRIFVFSEDGRFLHEFGEKGHLLGQFKHPEAIAHDYHGNLYVNDFWLHGFQKFSEKGQYHLKYPNQQSNQIACLQNGECYVANKYELSKTNGGPSLDIVRRWGTRLDDEPGVLQPRFPMGVISNGKDLLYLSDRELERMWQLDLSGKVQRTWPVLRQDYKSQMAVDAHNRVYVTTFENRQQPIQVFDRNGVGVRPQFVDETGRAMTVDLPIPVVAGRGNTLYVGSASLRRIYRFRYEVPGPGGVEVK